MYDSIYRFVFGLDIAIIGALMGFIGYISYAYYRIWRHETVPALKYRWLHVFLLGSSMFYLLFFASISLALTSSQTGSDPTIFFYPPGFVAMTIGLYALYKSGSARKVRHR